MTNVPDNLREMWADIYRLFDSNYLMQNTEEAWNQFWNQAVKIYEKYKEVMPRVMELLAIVGDMIGDRMKEKSA